jgi:hypothetical protein
LEAEHMPEESEDKQFARLADWVEGRLSEDEARTIEEHLSLADSATLAEVAWLRAFARISEEIVIASPPPEVREALIERFEAYAEGKDRPGFVRRLVARLTFDSTLRPALGLRAATVPETQRQLVYSTEAADVAMHVRPRPQDGLFDLYGQILPLNGTESGTFGIQVLEATSEVATTVTNELGEFTFEAVPPGVYEVLAGNERVEIRVPRVELNL